MQSTFRLSALIYVLTFLSQEATAARILGVFPHIGKSHFFVFEPMMKALAAHGHDVHVISHFPQDSRTVNYTDISIKGSITSVEPTGSVTFDMFGDGSTRIMSVLTGFILGAHGTATCESVLAYPVITQFLKSNEKFDLVITELFNADCFLGFAHKFQAPHIALSSCVLMPWANDRFGNPDNPSYIPVSMARFSNSMTFTERLENTFFYIMKKAANYFTIVRPQQSIASKYFGDSMPSLDAIARNTSLIIVNSHPSLNGRRPLVPAIIEVGGIHVAQPKKLPQDLDKWMCDAPEGVIYFSMGSMLRADSLPAKKLNALLQAFSEVPQRVLWKWDGDVLPGQPDNVRIGKWLPQRDILNHRNVRLFITHGGLLGVTEAVISAVPMVGIPIFGDQHVNLKAAAAVGVAVNLDFSQMTKESILEAVRSVAGNVSYRENAKRVSIEYMDRPSSPMDTAIYWTNYVIRHKGAPHLRSAAVDLPWYQYLLLDVGFVITSVLIAVIATIVCLVQLLIIVLKKRIFGSSNVKPKQL